MVRLSSVIGSLLSLATLGLAGTAEEWKTRKIYFALTDRIARTADDTGGDACGSLGSYCGGTWKGLQGKLDYIKGMGFDAIWLTPVVKNTEGGYHGYWASNLYDVNENYGTAQDLKDLVSAAHDKGVWIMVDVVANHMGEGDISSYGPEPLNSDAGYHSKCKVDYDDQNSIENCWVADLPDVNTESDEIQNVFNKWIKWLVNEYDFDGVRIDTVKHVPTAFWDSFSAAAGVYTIGEVFDGDVDYLAGYGSCMDGLLDYAGYYPQNAFYQGTGSAQEMADMIDTIGQKFEDPTLLGTFLDNHDNPRWLNDKSDTTLFKNGLAYVILSRGIPIVYYGSEQGYSGGADPANREDLWRSGFDTKADIYQALTAFNAARKSAGGLAKNDHKHLYIAQNAYAFSREGGDLIVLTTNGGKGSSGDHCFDAPKSGSWNILYGGDGKATADGGQLCLSVKDGEPVVLLAE